MMSSFDCSILKPSSLSELSDQFKSICVEEIKVEDRFSGSDGFLFCIEGGKSSSQLTNKKSEQAIAIDIRILIDNSLFCNV